MNKPNMRIKVFIVKDATTIEDIKVVDVYSIYKESEIRKAIKEQHKDLVKKLRGKNWHIEFIEFIGVK